MALSIVFRRLKFRWREAQANFSGCRTVVGGTHVVSGARVVRRKTKNAGGPGGGSPPAKPVKGGVWGGFVPPSQNSGGLGGSAPQPKPKIFRKFFEKF